MSTHDEPPRAKQPRRRSSILRSEAKLLRAISYGDEFEADLAGLIAALPSVRLDEKLETPDGEMQTLLVRAVVWDNARAVELLLTHGAAPDVLHYLNPGIVESTALSLACGPGGSADCALALLRGGANPHLMTAGNRLPMRLACTHGHVDIVRHLLKFRASANLTGDRGDPPLITACRHGHSEVCRVLCTAGALIDSATDSDEGNTALMVATNIDHKECVRVLLECGASPHTQNRQGNSPYKLALMSHKHAQLKLSTMTESAPLVISSVDLQTIVTSDGSDEQTPDPVPVPCAFDVD